MNNTIKNTYQQPTPKWLEDNKKNSMKPVFITTSKIFLSIFTGTISSMSTIVWLILGLFLAANYFEPLMPVRDLVTTSWRLIFVLSAIYYGWVNYREIRR